MICPHCNCRMSCNQTKNFTDEYLGFFYVERRRVCTGCGFTSMSIEVLQEDFNRRNING